MLGNIRSSLLTGEGHARYKIEKEYWSDWHIHTCHSQDIQYTISDLHTQVILEVLYNFDHCSLLE